MNDVVAATAAVLTLPRPENVDAVLMPDGQGERFRLESAVEYWQAHPETQWLLIAAGNARERTYQRITIDGLRELGLTREAGVAMQSRPVDHTGQQCAWAARIVAQHGIRSLGLIVPAYHLPRVFLTMLSALDDVGVHVRLHPMPVAVSPGAVSPESGEQLWDKVAGEADRILQYSARGYLATATRLRDYMAWWWAADQR